MSRKIYNKVVLEWSNASQQYETVYEDSYQYEGPIAHADEFDDFGEDIKKQWPEVAKDLTRELGKATKKAAKTGVSEFNKQWVSVGAGLSKMLTKSVAIAGSGIGKSLGAQIGNSISTALTGVGGSEGLRSLEKDLLDLEKRAPDLGKKLTGSIGPEWNEWLEKGHTAGDVWAKQFADAGEDIQQQNAVIGDLSQALGISAQQAEILLQNFGDGVDLATMFNDKIGEAPSKLQKMTKGLGNMAKGIELEEAEKEFADSIEAGISSGLDFIPSNAFTKALGVDVGLESAAKAFSESFKKQGAAMGQFMAKNWKAALGVGLAIGLAAMLIQGLAEATDEIGEKFGAIGVKEMRADLIDLKGDAVGLGFEFEDVASTVATLSSEFGISVDAAKGMTTGVLDTARALGLTTENAASLVGMLMTVTNMSAEQTENFLKQTEALAFSAGIAPGIVTADMADAAEEIAGFSKGTGENIKRAAIQARLLGSSLSDVAEVAEGLLDFETSINAELEASMMIGRQLNFQKARELALTGDLEGMMSEVLGQLGGEAEFNELNILQRKSLADAIGVSVDQMSKFVKFQGKSLDQQMSMRAMEIEELVGADAISGVTQLTNQLKRLKIEVLASFTWLGDFAGTVADFMSTDSLERQGQGWRKLLVVIGAVSLAWLAYLGFTLLKTAAQSVANRMLAKSYDKVAVAKTKARIAGATGGAAGAGQMLAGAAAMLILSAAVFVAAKGFKEFAGVEWTQVVIGTGAMIGLAITSKIMAQGSSDIIRGAAAMAILGVALIPAAFGLSLLGDVNAGQIIAVSLGLAVLAVVAAALGGLAGPMALGALAIGLLGFALIPAAKAFSLLADVPLDTIKAFSIAIPLLALATAGLGFLSPFIILGSLALMAMGKAFVVVGKGLSSVTDFISTLDPTTIVVIGGLTTALAGLAGSLLQVGVAGLSAKPIFGMLAGLGALGIIGGGGAGVETQPVLQPVHDQKTGSNITTLTSEIKGLRQDMKDYFGFGGTAVRQIGRAQTSRMAALGGAG